MYEIIIPINIKAYAPFFNKWITSNYDHKGIAYDQSNVTLSFTVEPSEVVKSEITNYYAALTELDGLDMLIHLKCEEINDKTGDLISLGYSFAGKTFSLSANAQTNLIALFATKDNAALTYPIEFNTLDDLDNYYAANAPAIEGMYLTALGTKKALLDSGSVLKDAVRASTTKADVDLVIDNR